jgi:hypothetical protein
MENKHNLYIIKACNDKNCLIKMGYTNNINKRLKTYYYNNPMITIINTYYREDAKEFEKYLHFHLKSEVLNEWYSIDKLNTIIDYINDSNFLIKYKENIDDSKKYKSIKIYSGSVKYEHLVDYFRSNHKKGIIEWREYSKKVKWINIIEMCYKLYNKVYKNQVYSETMIKNFNANEKAIIKSVSTLFAVGNRYSRKLVKDKLNRFYKDNNIKRTAKHTDIYEYFNLTEVTVRGERYIEILNRK